MDFEEEPSSSQISQSFENLPQPILFRIPGEYVLSCSSLPSISPGPIHGGGRVALKSISSSSPSELDLFFASHDKIFRSTVLLHGLDQEEGSPEKRVKFDKNGVPVPTIIQADDLFYCRELDRSHRQENHLEIQNLVFNKGKDGSYVAGGERKY